MGGNSKNKMNEANQQHHSVNAQWHVEMRNQIKSNQIEHNTIQYNTIQYNNTLHLKQFVR